MQAVTLRNSTKHNTIWGSIMYDFDTILQEIGEFGRYQKLVMILMCIPGAFMNAYNCFQLVFLMYTPPHRCRVPDVYINNSDLNVTSAECSLSVHSLTNGSTRTESCSQWEYDTEYFDSTIITEWDLVCDHAIDSKISLSVNAVAAVIGCLFYAYVQDCFGRKPAFLLNTTTYIVGATASLFVPNIWAFTAVRVISAINGIASWNICYIWALEYVGPSYRAIVTAVMCVMYGIAMTSISLVAYLCRTWFQMGLASTLPFIFLFSYAFIVMESPRWLLSQGRTKEAAKIIDKLIRWQEPRPSPKKAREVLQSLLNHEDALDNDSQPNPAKRNAANERKGQLWDLFRRKQLRRKTLILTLAWVANAVVYTSISFNTENLGGNLYVTWAILAFTESPGCIFILLLNKTGRIWPLSTFMMVSGLCCLATAPSESLSQWLVISFALVGKFAISVTYSTLYQLAGELFPTVVRGMGIGFGSIIGDAGNILMPYIIYSAKAYKMLPMIILGLLAFVAGFATLLLPETMGRNMPESLEEAEIHGKVEWKTVQSHFRRLNCRKQVPKTKECEV